jgi:tripartite ATP-independent transporter DctM subunit
VVFTLLPPLVLIFLVLGTIFLGIATPTEGGAMGAVGAVVLAWMRGRLTMSVMRQALDSSAKLTTFVLFVLIGSTVFALVFRAVDGDLWVEHLFALVPGGQLGFLLVVNVIVFLLGFFIDFFEIAFILLPLLGPVADKLGIDLIWFGVMIGMNLQTSFLTPPFGFALFYLRSVAPPSIETSDIYRGVVNFIVIQLFALATILIWPQTVLWMTGAQKKGDPGNVNIEVQTFDQQKDEDTSMQDLLKPGGGQAPKPPANEDALERMLREQGTK